MMFKSKSFDLVTEEKVKKPERLYQPKRMRWLKYIAIPALIGFCLMLIFANVDFSCVTYWEEVEHTATAIATPKPSKRWPTMPTTAIASTKSTPAISSRSWCQIDDKTFCKITCSNIVNLSSALEMMQAMCDDALRLYIHDCEFPDGNLTKDIFSGSFTIVALSIVDCSLNAIADDAFRLAEFGKLTTLALVNTQLLTLQSSTFAALQNLRNFTLINQSRSFKGIAFLQPMAGTLQLASVRQRTSVLGQQLKINPDIWFGNLTFSMLENLNLNGNALVAQWNATMLRQMPTLRSLTLSNCSIANVSTEMFANNWANLSFIDLTANQLTTLAEDLIDYALEYDLELVLHDNQWDCSCTNIALIYYIKQRYATESPRCATPSELYQHEMQDLDIDCAGDGTTSDSTEEMTTLTTTTGVYSTSLPSKSTTPTTTTTTTTTTTLQPAITTTPFWTTTTGPWGKTVQISCLTAHGVCEKRTLRQDAEITNILNLNTSSVHITLDGPVNVAWRMVYFTKATNIAATALQPAEHSALHRLIIIGLECQQLYVFCVVLRDDSATQAYNCLAHLMPNCMQSDSETSEEPTVHETWFHRHATLIIMLGCIGILLCIAAGLGLTYLLLRQRPTWLRGSKRLIRESKRTQKMLLLRKEEDVRNEDICTHPNVNDSQHYYSTARNVETTLDNRPPSQRAPSASIVPDMLRYNDLYQKDTGNFHLNYVYESLEPYEELF